VTLYLQPILEDDEAQEGEIALHLRPRHLVDLGHAGLVHRDKLAGDGEDAVAVAGVPVQHGGVVPRYGVRHAQPLYLLRAPLLQYRHDMKLHSTVGDPDPHVFGPPGSGSISQR
jgi:hypothetical protein